MSIATTGNEFYYDLHSLDAMRQKAKKDKSGALREVAKQFEAIFMKMMLKSMRDASPGNPLFDSESEKFYTQMYDDQLSTDLTKNGSLGIADMMVAQLEGKYNKSPGSRISPRASQIEGTLIDMKPSPGGIIPNTQNSKAIKAYIDIGSSKTETQAINATQTYVSDPETPEEFIASVWPHAKTAGEQLQVKPEVLIAQAALETGWGKHVIRDKQGFSSHNLFNIKADQRWSGKRVEKETTEFLGGAQVQEKAMFRAYSSLQDSFNDYVNFLTSNSRYQQALQHSEDPERYVRELQAAGYATDPRYADKIVNILGREQVKDTVQQLRAKEAQKIAGITNIGGE